jgi:threonine aldolase
MRQAGILAAAGIVALETMVDRLSDDHRHAKKLAEGLASIEGLELYMGMPQTNMVFVSVSETVPLTADLIAQRLANFRVKVGVVGKRSFRLVTHYWIGENDIDHTVSAFRAVRKEA